MTEILYEIIALLKADGSLGVKSESILTGAVDLVQESQASLMYPYILLSVVSESQRSNPLNTRDTHVQVDIWSRTSQLEVQSIYERVVADLKYLTENNGSAHIFWSRIEGAVDHFESDRRIWHRAVTVAFWSVK